MKNSKKVGFTLVEMIVTLMIIITLSLLSFPLYKGRNHTTSKLAEGYALLGTVIDAQVGYYNEYGYFLSHNRLRQAGITSAVRGSDTYTCNDPILGINALNNRYFTWFNAYGNYQSQSDGGAYMYHFTAIVASANAGIISLEYNLTQRFEPKVSGI